MLTESHIAVFLCELCEKLCETLWETLSLTANASHIKRTGCIPVIDNVSSNEESPLACRNGTLMTLIFMMFADFYLFILRRLLGGMAR